MVNAQVNVDSDNALWLDNTLKCNIHRFISTMVIELMYAIVYHHTDSYQIVIVIPRYN